MMNDRAGQLMHDNAEELANLLAQASGFAPQVAAAANKISNALRQGNKLLACGNGGSAADASRRNLYVDSTRTVVPTQRSHLQHMGEISRRLEMTTISTTCSHARWRPLVGAAMCWLSFQPAVAVRTSVELYWPLQNAV